MNELNGIAPADRKDVIMVSAPQDKSNITETSGTAS